MTLRSTMAECRQYKPNLKKAAIIQVVYFAIALAINALIVYLFDTAIIGWFFFGLISGIGVLIAYREKGDRFTTVNIIFMIAVALICAGLNYLFSV